MSTLVDTIRFAIEPHFTLRACSSPSSEDSDAEDGFVVPFTTSPLDECRGGSSSGSGSEKSPTRLRGYAAATHKKRRRFIRPQNTTMRRRH